MYFWMTIPESSGNGVRQVMFGLLSLLPVDLKANRSIRAPRPHLPEPDERELAGKLATHFHTIWAQPRPVVHIIVISVDNWRSRPLRVSPECVRRVAGLAAPSPAARRAANQALLRATKRAASIASNRAQPTLAPAQVSLRQISMARRAALSAASSPSPE